MRILDRLEEIIVSITIAIATVLSFIEVVLRYVFDSSLGFTQELVIYLLITAGLIGASMGIRSKVHIGVDVIVKQFPFPLQKGIKLAVLTTCIAFCIIITFLGIQQVQILMDFGQVTPEMEIPYYVPLLIIPISFGLMSIRFIQEIVKQTKIPAEKTYIEEEGVHQ